MTGLLRAEILKLRTVKAGWVLVAVAAVIAALVTVLFVVRTADLGASSAIPPLGTRSWARLMLGFSDIGEDFALVLGILCVTGEYRHGTITSTFLAVPKRGKVIGAKLITSLGAGLVIGAVLAVVVMGAGIPLAVARQVPASSVLRQVPAVVPGAVVATGLYGLYGAGVGALVRNQVLAIASALAFSLVGEGIVSLLAPQVGRWLPDNAAAALTGSTPGASLGRLHLLVWWEGGLVMLAYGVLSAAVGVATTLRADVT